MRADSNCPGRTVRFLALAEIAALALPFSAGLGGCSKTTATSSNTSASPDGRHVLVTTAHHRRNNLAADNYIRIEIRDRKGHVEHDEKIRCAGQARWHTRWDKSNRVWLENPDLGVFYWEQAGEGRWQRHDYETGKSPEPPFVLSHADA